jgi:hypothetical protein
MGEGSVEPELRALTERIAAVRSAIVEVKAERARIEGTQAPLDDGPETALAALRVRFTETRARFADLERHPGRRLSTSTESREAAARRSLYVIGAMVALPGLVTVAGMLHVHGEHPEEPLDPMLVLVFSLPLLLGLALIARARFANYRADHDDLDGDFLG